MATCLSANKPKVLCLVIFLGFSIWIFPQTASAPSNARLLESFVQQESAIASLPAFITSPEILLGQNLIVGIPSPILDQESIALLSQIKPAGIVLYQRNFSSHEQLKQLIQDLQDLALESTGSPYFILLDEEPEGANRLGLLKNIFTLGQPEWRKIERDIQTLADLGITVLLAPLADFPFHPNSFISRRIPFRRPEDLKAFNRTFIRLLQDHGIQATLKHFPGLGLFSDDPHHTYIRTDSGLDELQTSMALFEDGIAHGAQWVMSCHAQYDSIDPENPSTFSYPIISSMLKESIGFAGIIVTDDLSDMPLAIENLDLTYAGIRALQAGHHLIMYSHRLPDTWHMVQQILQRIEEDPKFSSLVYENYQKIVQVKQELYPTKLYEPRKDDK